MKKALIVQGGWDGHEPKLTSKRFEKLLKEMEFEVEVSDTLEAFGCLEKLKELDLIVACWTMGEITQEQSQNVTRAVASGVGLAGCHGAYKKKSLQRETWKRLKVMGYVEEAAKEVERKQEKSGGRLLFWKQPDSFDKYIYIL